MSPGDGGLRSGAASTPSEAGDNADPDKDHRASTCGQRRFPLRAVLVAAGCLSVGGVFGAAVVGAQPEAAGPSALVVLDAYRNFDTRVGAFPSKLVVGSVYEIYPGFDLATGQPVELPPGTVAVMYTVTVTETEGAGFLEIGSLPLTDAATSNINWYETGQTSVNSGVTRVKAADAGALAFGVLVGGTAQGRAHVIIDIEGYYVEV